MTSASSSARVFLGSAVDTTTDTIAFTSPHNLETGDHVYYWVPTGSTSLPDLSSGSVYTVFVVDDTHIKLQNQAVKTASGNANLIDNGTHFIQFANTFSTGDYVTYHAPAPLETFSSLQVDQTFNSSNNPAYTSTNNDQIFFAKDSGDANHTPTGSDSPPAPRSSTTWSAAGRRFRADSRARRTT